MSDSKNINDWMRDWDALQRQYFNAWSDLAQKAPFAVPPQAGAAGFMGANPFVPPSPSMAAGFAGFPPFGGFPGAIPSAAASAPWQEGLDQWMRLFAGADKQNDVVERLIESAKSYVAMTQSGFGAAPPMGEGAANPAQAWFDAMRSGLGAANLTGFDPATNPFAKAVRDVAGKGAQGFAELPAAFAPYLEQMRKEGMSWLQVPAFGLAREHQEHYQRTAVALFEYEHALREYNRLMLKASQRGFELFERRLADRSEPGRTIESLKALYDLWVDAAEDAYAEIALSEEFSKAYGELANAQMRLRKQIQTEVERVSREFGMPTRSEVDSLSKRVHDLGRELRNGGSARNGDEIETELAALRSEIGALKKSLARPGVAAKRAEEAAPAAVVDEPVARGRKPTRAAPKVSAAVERRPRRSAAAKSRAPAAVVRPKPAAEAETADASRVASFADAVAAMRRRVNGGTKRRATAAQMSKPSKRNDEKAGKKKRKKGD